MRVKQRRLQCFGHVEKRDTEREGGRRTWRGTVTQDHLCWLVCSYWREITVRQRRLQWFEYVRRDRERGRKENMERNSDSRLGSVRNREKISTVPTEQDGGGEVQVRPQEWNKMN